MDWLKKALLIALASFLLIGGIGTLAFPQGAVTLVQLVLGGTVVSNSNPLPVSGTFSASIAGFTPNGSFANLTATNASASVALPTGTVVAVQNTGTTTVSCTLGVGSATAAANEIQVPASSTVFVTVGSNTFGACIDQTGSTSNVVVFAGGAGLGTGFGGGGGSGGGGGTVTQGPTGTNAAAWWVQIGDTTNGPAAVATAGADAVSNTQNGLSGYARNEVFNGTTWDRLRSGTATGSIIANNATAANLNATVVGAGVAGTPSGGVVSIQGVASGTVVPTSVASLPLPTGAATSANQPTNAAQGSTTSGQTGNLIQCAVTTVAPAYTTAQTDPLSCDTAGNIRVTVTNTNPNGQATMANSSPVVIASNQSAVPVTLTSTTITGTVAAVGPTAVGSANANPPVVIGGTATGAAGQNVQGLSIVAPSVAPVTATNTAVVVDLRPDSPGIITLGPASVANSVPFTFSSQYPTNATTTTPTAVTATATGTTAATAASLGATASVTNFVCGFDITADATALTTGTATLSGTISGSLNYIQTVQAVASGSSQLTRTFNPCIPASAANTAITITSAAAGTAGNTIVNIWGYRL